jgi:hypothetical protein
VQAVCACARANQSALIRAFRPGEAVRGAFPAAIAAKFFRKVNFLVCPAPEPGEAARAQWRCALRRDSVESLRIAETSILSALPRCRQFSAANFVKQNLCAGALA